MTPAEYERIGRELYSDTERSGHFSYPSDYNPIIAWIGDPVVVVRTDDYQGDTFAMVETEGRFGVISFSWGSCCGCDALQSCESFEEVGKLAEKIRNETRWFEAASDAAAWLESDDRKLDASHYSIEWSPFVSEVRAFVTKSEG